jgi:hypothetical protein
MSLSSDRNTIYLEPDIQIALAAKARNCGLTISEVIDDAVRNLLHEDDLDSLAYSAGDNDLQKSSKKQH